MEATERQTMKPLTIPDAATVRGILDGTITEWWEPLRPQPERRADSLYFGWATIWDNGTVFTWDRDGVGGENWHAEQYPNEHAPTEAYRRAVQQGFVKNGYAAGDRLFLREAWFPASPNTYRRVMQSESHQYRMYEADGEIMQRPYFNGFVDSRPPDDWFIRKYTGAPFRWRPAHSMPLWASRCVVEVEEVRAKQLHAITFDEVMATGCPIAWPADGEADYDRDGNIEGGSWFAQSNWFRDRWNRCFPGFDCEQNRTGWAWVVKFRRVA